MAEFPIGFVRSLCIQDVFRQLQTELGTRAIAWETPPGLMSESDTFNQRMADVAQRKRANVNFVSVVKRFIRRRYQFWTFEESDGDFVIFENLPVARLSLRLLFERNHHWGLGKAFSLGLGIKLDSDDFGTAVKIDSNLFTLFGSDDRPGWSYVTEEDLENYLLSVGHLLDQVLDRFEAIAMASLFPLPTKAPESIEVRGNLSAQEGWEIARPLAYFQARDKRRTGRT